MKGEDGKRIMTKRFSTYLLDQALIKGRERREKRRQERLAAVLLALNELSFQIPFEEAYIFGSLAKPYSFFEESDVDVAVVGLKSEYFFKAIAFLSRELCAEVDIIQLEGHPLREVIAREGIRWKKRG